MVDIGKKKDRDSKQKEQKQKDKPSSSGSKSGSKRQSGGSPDAFEMEEDMVSTPSGGDVADTAKDWSSDHGELNYDTGSSGSLKNYKKKQIAECQEFYENFYEMVEDNLVDINQFTLYYQALTMNMARNRVGIQSILEQEFNMSKEEALKHTQDICQKAGEAECMTKVLNDVSLALQDDEEVMG